MTANSPPAVTAMQDADMDDASSSDSSGDEQVFHPPQQHQQSALDKIHAVSPRDRPTLSSVKVIASTHAPHASVDGADATVYVDFDVPDSLDKVLQTHKCDYVLYIPSFSENRIKQTQNVVDVVLQHRRGVRYFVMISILSARPVKSFVGLRTGTTRTMSMSSLAAPASTEHVHPVHTEFIGMEKIVAKSGISYTFLQVGFFNHQLFEIARRSIMMNTGSVPTIGLPLGMGTFAPVDVRDPARVAATLFLTFPHSHINKAISITGPTLLSGPSLVGAMSKGLDIPLRYVNVPMTQFATFLSSSGICKDKRSLEGMLGLFATISSGDWSYLGEDVAKFTITGPGQVGESGDLKQGKGRRKPKPGIRVEELFKERRDEVTETVEASPPKSVKPSQGATVRRVASVSHSFDPNLPSSGPISYISPPISLSAKLSTSPMSSLSSSFIEGATTGQPTTTWWEPTKLEKKIGGSMTADEWRAKYAPKEAAMVPLQEKGGFVEDDDHHDVLQKVQYAVEQVVQDGQADKTDQMELEDALTQKLDLHEKATPQKKSGLSIGLAKE